MRGSTLLRGLAVAAALATMSGAFGDRPPAVFGVSAAQAAPAGINIQFFFSSLQPYGEWVRNADYNYVWVPTSVDPNWSPYTNGGWVYTDRYGWYFQSHEPFAWIVYHYGRWGYDRNIGWFWVPGTRWAPAWVAWRRSDQDFGWAPLPPEGRGFAVDINITINIGALPENYWRFVRANQFLEPDLHSLVVSFDRDPEPYRRSQPAGSVIVQNNVVINNVITLDFIQQVTKQKVEVRQVKETTDPKQVQATQTNQGALTAFVADLGQPTTDAKPDKVVDEKQIQAAKPPTSGQTATPPADQGAAPAGAAPAAEQPATAKPPKLCADGSAPLADGTCATPAAPAAKQPATTAKPPKACADGSAPLADGTCAAPAK